MSIQRVLVYTSLLLLIGCPTGGVGPLKDSANDTGPGGQDSEPEDTDVVLSGVNLSQANMEIVGESQGDYAGIGVASAGDVDGDGMGDLLIGAAGNDDGGVGSGKAYLVLSRQIRELLTLDLDEAHSSFLGESTGDSAGDAVANVGDVNGDGHDDLLIGAFENDDGAGNAGKAYLLSGIDLAGGGSYGLGDADWAFVGEDGAYSAGISVGGAGDVNGDGLDDMVVSALGQYTRGYVHLVLGSQTASGVTPLSMATYSWSGEAEGDSAGICVEGAGDVDGDGLGDVVVGAFGRDASGEAAGAAYLILADSMAASSGGDLSGADYTLAGESAGDTAGFAVSGAGDVDGDGLDDVLVGADCSDEAGALSGKAYLVLGGSLGSSPSHPLGLADLQLLGESGGDRAGGAVGSAGDVDGDGVADLLVGACYNSDLSDRHGKVYLLLADGLPSSGSLGLGEADRAWVGEFPGDLAGRAVSTAGDGDGLADLAIGATHTNQNGNDSGKVYLIFAGDL